jgi:hypothetical protein
MGHEVTIDGGGIGKDLRLCLDEGGKDETCDDVAVAVVVVVVGTRDENTDGPNVILVVATFEVAAGDGLVIGAVVIVTGDGIMAASRERSCLLDGR